MKIIVELRWPHLRDPRTIPTYFRHYYGRPRPQWRNSKKKLGLLDVLKLWWVIEGC